MHYTLEEQNLMGRTDADMTSCHAAMGSTSSAPDTTHVTPSDKGGRDGKGTRIYNKREQDGDRARI